LLRALLALAIPRHLDLFRRRGEPHREDDEGANHANEDREDQARRRAFDCRGASPVSTST